VPRLRGRDGLEREIATRSSSRVRRRPSTTAMMRRTSIKSLIERASAASAASAVARAARRAVKSESTG
jgi:hypothetical protein